MANPTLSQPPSLTEANIEKTEAEADQSNMSLPKTDLDKSDPFDEDSPFELHVSSDEDPLRSYFRCMEKAAMDISSPDSFPSPPESLKSEPIPSDFERSLEPILSSDIPWSQEAMLDLEYETTFKDLDDQQGPCNKSFCH